MAAWSPSSSSSLSSKSSSPLNVKGLNATIFGMNRLSIRDGPRNVIKCLDADRSGQNGSGPLSRQLYLNERLAKTDRMYTTDIIGHHSCVNTIALSNLGEQFLVSGEIKADQVAGFVQLVAAVCESRVTLFFSAM